MCGLLHNLLVLIDTTPGAGVGMVLVGLLVCALLGAHIIERGGRGNA